MPWRGGAAASGPSDHVLGFDRLPDGSPAVGQTVDAPFLAVLGHQQVDERPFAQALERARDVGDPHIGVGGDL